MFGSLAFTMFVILNSYEVIFNTDLRYISTLQSLKPSHVVLQAVQAAGNETTPAHALPVGLGTPYTLRVPVVDARLQLVEGIERDGQWLARANRGHYVTPNTGEQSEQLLVIYAAQGWRTIANPSGIGQGDNIFLDTTDDWRYLFRVSEHTLVAAPSTFVVPASETAILLLVIEDATADVSHVIRADFISLQNIP